MTADDVDARVGTETAMGAFAHEVARVAAQVAGSSDDPLRWLEQRWARLDHVDPVVAAGTSYSRTTGKAEFTMVRTDLVAAVDGPGRWGEINNRYATYSAIMSGLIDAHLQGDAGEWVRRMGRPDLMSVPGPYGPLYETGTDGRHRTHVFKGLGVSQFPAVTHPQDSEVVPGATIYIPRPIRHQPYRGHGDQRPRTPQINPHARSREAIVAQLIDVCVLEPDTRDNYYRVLRPVPAQWVLWGPEAASRYAVRYRRSYAQFGQDDEAEAALLDPGTWVAYLERSAPPRPIAVSEPLPRALWWRWVGRRR